MISATLWWFEKKDRCSLLYVLGHCDSLLKVDALKEKKIKIYKRFLDIVNGSYTEYS